jgi:hypothetical protein
VSNIRVSPTIGTNRQIIKGNESTESADRLLKESRQRALEELRRLESGKDQDSFQYSSDSDGAQRKKGAVAQRNGGTGGLNAESSVDSLDTLDRALAVRSRVSLSSGRIMYAGYRAFECLLAVRERHKAD